MDKNTLPNNKVVNTFKKLRELGLIGSFDRARHKIIRAVVMQYERLGRRKHIIFKLEYDRRAISSPLTPKLNIHRFVSVEQIPLMLLRDLETWRGTKFVEMVRQEFNTNAVLWVGMIDDEVAGTSMSRAGRHFPRWYLPLLPDDLVIFANSTVLKHRGKRVCPSIMRHVCSREFAELGTAYVDCVQWNTPSIRSIEYAGFVQTAVMKPLVRKDVFK
jgi:hypothetical protein